MNRPFMRKHVKQKPSVNGVELDLNQRVDFFINGKLKLLTVEDAIQTAPCLLRLRLYHPSTKCEGAAIQPRHGSRIRLTTLAWQKLQDKLKESNCPEIYPGQDCCKDNPDIVPEDLV